MIRYCLNLRAAGEGRTSILWTDSGARRRRRLGWLVAGVALVGTLLVVWLAPPVPPLLPAAEPVQRAAVLPSAARAAAQQAHGSAAGGALLDASPRSAAMAPGFEAQLLTMVYGSMGGATLWKVFQGGVNSDDPQQRVLAYRALRLCAAASPPYSAYAPPLIERPAWMSDSAIVQADRARSEMLLRCAPFAIIRPDERNRFEHDLGSALDVSPRPPARGTAPTLEQTLTAERDQLRDAFERFGAAALIWAGADLLHFTEQLAAHAASGAAPLGSPATRLIPGVPELALCELGANCETDSNAALSLCYATGNCTGTLRERLLGALATEEQRGLALVQAQQLAAALRNGDLRGYGL